MKDTITLFRKATWFREYEKDIFSKQGEDGILEKLFKVIGTKNNFSIECGALNGIHDSCVRNLIVNENWSGLLIEGDESAFEALKENYSKYNKAKCIHAFISFKGPYSVDTLFEKHEVPLDPDLFVLDIDGNEYHIWESMCTYRPRVMVIEFNPTIPNEVSFIQPKNMNIQQGSSLKALYELGLKKGYELVAVTDLNAFFVDKNIDREFFKDYETELDTLRPNNPFETKLYQLYDGTLKISGYDSLFWHKKKIDENKLQVLNRSERIFPNGINSNATIRKIKYLVRKTPLYPIVIALRKNSIFRRLIK